MAEAEITVKLADYAEVQEVITIIRAVADCEPMAYCPGDEMSGDWYECGFCGRQADATSRYGEWGDVAHDATCPWLRAHEWIQTRSKR